MLPKKWWTNSKLIEIYLERERKLCETNKSAKRVWDSQVNYHIGCGLSKEKAEIKAAQFFLKNMIHKGDVPSRLQWNGKDHFEDTECYCCKMLVKAGVIEKPGKLRYLGTHLCGTNKICVEKHDEDGEPYYEDAEFPCYLAMYRCEVCGNEYTDE